MFLMNVKDNVTPFFLLFFIIFGPVLDVALGPLADISFFASSTALLVYFRWYIPRFILILWILLFALAVISLITALLFDSAVISISFRAILRPIKALIYLTSIYLIVRAWIEKGTEPVRIIEMIFLAIVLHAAIMLIQFLLPEFRSFVYGFTMAKYQLEHYQTFRMAGLSGGGGAQLSFTQSFGFLIGIYLIKKRRFTPIFIWICNLMILMSIFLSGRSGFIFVLISLMFFSIYSFLYKDFTIRAKAQSVVLFSGLSFLLLQSSIMDFEFFKIAFERNFDTLIRYQETGDVKDNTFNALAEMIIVPDTYQHLIFGVASYLENNTFYDINTDIGYFRLIWGYGIIGLILHIVFYVLLFLKIFRGLKGQEYFLLIAVFAFVFIFNAKEISFFSKMSFQIFLFISFSIFFMKEYKFKNDKES